MERTKNFFGVKPDGRLVAPNYIIPFSEDVRKTLHDDNFGYIPHHNIFKMSDDDLRMLQELDRELMTRLRRGDVVISVIYESDIDDTTDGSFVVYLDRAALSDNYKYIYY